MVENILSVRRNFKRRLFFVWALLIFFIAYLIAVGAGYFVFYTSFFKIEKFEFSGFQKTDAVFLKHFLILERFKNSGWRGFLVSDNFLFWFGFEPANIKLPVDLASLKFSANFFERKVLIEVSERQPFGIWCPGEPAISLQPPTPNLQPPTFGSCFWFDESAVLFAPAPFAEGLLIPLIFDDNSRPEKLSSEIFSIFQRLYKLENIKIAKFSVKNENLKELEAEIVNGPKIYLSLKYENSDLEAILEKLNNEVEFKNLEYIDLRVPGRIYYK
ncbi:MAG: hypothetical protein AAB772_01660 [Patescibacteria group bacterium]